MLKKILALTLAALTVLGALTACGNTGSEETAAPTEPAIVDYTKQEDGNLKILTLGHSLAVDAGHMLALVAEAEGVTNLTVGTLYYSGCPLNKHVEFSKNNLPNYQLYLSNSNEGKVVPSKMENVTMKDALRYQDWDIIIMQGGVFEIAKSETFTNGDIQTIQEYVKANVLKKDFIFAWNMAWAPATMDDLKAKYPLSPNTYISNYEPYGNDRQALFADFTKCAKDHIFTDSTFKFFIPSGTAFENAMTSYLTEYDLHRDYVHATDLGRLIISYTWFCKLAGIEKLTELKLTAIPKNHFISSTELFDHELTDAEKNVILESVNNALANPLQITNSQYTEAPAA